MASVNDDRICFRELERELNAAIDEDARYWRENEAKLRTVSQSVPSYEEFREIVKAIHLRPLEKGDRISSISGQNRNKGSIWNSLANKRKPDCSISSETYANVVMEKEKLPRTTAEFLIIWKHRDVVERQNLLRQMGPSVLGHLFRNEIPSGLLGDIFHTLLAFTPTTKEIVLVVSLLEALTEAKRFSLNLEFLTGLEKSTCSQLLDKLSASLQDRQQDLAELGVTEYTLMQLRQRYEC